MPYNKIEFNQHYLLGYKMSTEKKIGICISTRNRENLFSWVKSLIENQTVGLKSLCIIVIDGGNKNKHVWDSWEGVEFKYIWLPNIVLGASRNRAIKEARELGCKYIALWDDDDWYAPNYLEESVCILKNGENIVGISQFRLWFKNSCEMWELGPYEKNHGLEPTLVFKANWSHGHYFDDWDQLARGSVFLKGYKERLVQMNKQLYLHIAHNENTFKKELIRENPSKFRAKYICNTDFTCWSEL